jgi:cytochrome c oxidase assembly protein subunit 17
MGQALTKGVQPGAANAKEVGAAPTVGETKTDMTQHDKSTDKPKPCCACPETKKARDECFLLSGDNAEIACKDLIEAHRKCMRQYGYNV